MLLLFSMMSNDKENVYSEPEVSYEWDILGVKYARISIDSLETFLGPPQETEMILVGEEPLIEIWNGLHRFQKHRKDTLIFKQLYYKQDEMDFYIWLLPDADSIWRVVDAVKYNPDRVQFSMYSIYEPDNN